MRQILGEDVCLNICILDVYKMKAPNCPQLFLLNIYKIVSTFAIEIFIKLNNETFYYYIAIDFGNICFL